MRKKLLYADGLDRWHGKYLASTRKCASAQEPFLSFNS